MKGAVSKVASRRFSLPSLSLTQNAGSAGHAMLTGVGRVPYHTDAAKAIHKTAPAPHFSPAFNDAGSVHINDVGGVHFNDISVAKCTTLPTPKLPKEIVWLLGAPGAGKGTNSAHVATSRGFNAPTIVMSSLLENPECKRIKDAGGMVDDATVCRALLEELGKPEYRNGVVVDGFPRTKEQAEWLSSLHDSLSETRIPPKFNFVMLNLSEEVSVTRQLSRGTAIRELNKLRRLGGLDALEERATDLSDAHARTRYRVFAEQYEAVTKLSSRFSLTLVDADASIDVVRLRLSSVLGKPTQSPSRFQPISYPSASLSLRRFSIA